MLVCQGQELNVRLKPSVTLPSDPFQVFREERSGSNGADTDEGDNDFQHSSTTILIAVPRGEPDGGGLSFLVRCRP